MKPVAIVTGGMGFIGSHMVDLLLKEGYRVRVIDDMRGSTPRNLEHVKNSPDLALDHRDICTIPVGDSIFEDVEYVYHFAGIGDIVPSIDRPLEYMRVNVLGTVQMLECARKAKIKKFVYAASSSCYGLAEQIPTPESAKISPEYPYALSKYQGEQAVFHWGKLYKLPVASVRIFNAYGTRSRTSGAYGAVFGVFLAQKLNGLPFTVVGDGTQTRDFVYVTDVARAFYMVGISERKQEHYNLGSGRKPPSVNRLVELLQGEVVHIPDRPGEPKCTWANTSKIESEIGWKSTVSFEEGVGKMLENIEYWREAPIWDPKSIDKATKGWFEAFTN